MLKVENLHVAYGHIEVLKGISFAVEPGAIVALIGSNGAGKTTTLSTISGLLRPISGKISWKGEDIQTTPVETIVAAGLAHCPEGRRIFPGLTVRENLLTGTASRRFRRKEIEDDLAQVFDLFPRLKERIKQGGWSLSGGEQQMLAIGRALMSRPSLLMLDEPSLGLAPRLCSELFRTLARIKETGVGIFLVEQNAKQSLAIADRGYLLDNGHIVGADSAQALANDEKVRTAYLGDG
jgi:branched-chain amino acid transport system ATP-binding protein